MKATQEDAQKMSEILEVLKEEKTYRLIQAVGLIPYKESLKTYIRNTKDSGNAEEINKVKSLEEFGSGIESAANNREATITRLTIHLHEIAKNKNCIDNQEVIDFLFYHKPIFEFLHNNHNKLREISESLMVVLDEIVPLEVNHIEPPKLIRKRSLSVSEERGNISDAMTLKQSEDTHIYQ